MSRKPTIQIQVDVFASGGYTLKLLAHDAQRRGASAKPALGLGQLGIGRGDIGDEQIEDIAEPSSPCIVAGVDDMQPRAISDSRAGILVVGPASACTRLRCHRTRTLFDKFHQGRCLVFAYWLRTHPDLEKCRFRGCVGCPRVAQMA
jgi:hypothetical protein